MLRILLVALAASMCGLEGHCQLKKFYTVKSHASYDTVDFVMKATSGTCFVKPSHHNDPLTIYGNPSLSEVNPTFTSSIRSTTNFVKLELEDYNKKGLSHAITYNVFGGEKNEEEKDFWKVYLTDEKIYNLNLSYGVGDSYINLSNVAVAKIKIESGSADVHINYDEGGMNRCQMDTFSVVVDLGTLVAERMHLSQAKHVIAEVGFGTAVLDFSKGVNQKCNVNASIGAGTLKVRVPESNFAAIIRFKSSPLCKYSLEQGFKKIDTDVYVSKGYDENAENLMEFVVDVALGNITFEYVK
ncbi:MULTISPECIES: hypothetical protein [Reichenbachiella]|uniref:Uncharacterized protein n=1 Tax=Reichenbachiella agariperforans TaxID=156994 RepID=A0A1M6NQF2_REIAG|nr:MULTISPECIES: hypothetical protein [Reichenbachiella]SHJ97904.1 hypothetical protein SAMN04488028_102357 [Reichenbachiella agariperforans]